VGGAVATATHGSGDGLRNLAGAVEGVKLVLSSGEVISVQRADRQFAGVVVGLGALGVVVELTLAVEPYYEVSQQVFDGLEWDALFEHFDEIMGSGYSVSVFHRFGPRTEQVWVKRRVDANGSSFDLRTLGAERARSPRNPVPGADPANCTEQGGVAGPWSERLPHFRSGFLPSSGEEIQSEFFVARSDAVAALEALRGLSEAIQPLLLVSELRTIAGDELWLSPHYRRDGVGLHFTWRREQAAVEAVLGSVEAALAPFGARPHWGKLFTASAVEIAPLYERLPQFMSLRSELDPRGAFVNDWLERHILRAY
jgi:xylitol oxidase